ncbi:MAG TPA: MBL fold metallo-hydrolase [Verrucomicrobiae bacterium]|nr:MBL fold metallo-hydrolase [Verrucomicrobiae bacterium]
MHGLRGRGLTRPASGLEAIIRVLLLGVAAGGGLPQWNCACANCQQARSGVLPPQTQSSVAVGDEAGNWFLINASPDLPVQIRTHAALAPNPGSSRNSPISGVFLTSADVDHVAGLLSLREGDALHIYTTPAIQQAAAILGVTTVLKAFCGVVWHHSADGCFPGLRGKDGSESSLRVRALPLSGRAPRYAEKSSKGDVCTLALQFLDTHTGGRLLVAPGVAEWSKPLQEAASESAVVLMDGTFWSEDELRRVRAGAAGASEMGHLPIKDGTLSFMSALPCPHRVYVHINNTNPIFVPGSTERALVESAGVIVGHDGMSFDL